MTPIRLRVAKEIDPRLQKAELGFQQMFWQGRTVGTGVPFQRLERLQEHLGMPLPAATQ
jgi:hypothetical protein